MDFSDAHNQRILQYIAKIAGYAITVPEPVTRVELYLSKMLGKNITVPEPVSRVEQYLRYILTYGVRCGFLIGKNQSGEAVLVEVDESGNLVITALPASVVVTTPPDKLDYTDGEEIDFTGIVVTAYNADGTLWTNEDYPDGIIPLDELTFEPTWAVYPESEGET